MRRDIEGKRGNIGTRMEGRSSLRDGERKEKETEREAKAETERTREQSHLLHREDFGKGDSYTYEALSKFRTTS